MNVTNLQNKGWISADRGTKATLMRTIPRSLFKSYTKDLSLPIFELVLQSSSLEITHIYFVMTGEIPWQCYDLGYTYIAIYIPIRTHDNIEMESNISTLFSADSGLEAFSRYPTHGSFSALTFPSTEFTNYVNQRFLSYWIGLLLCWRDNIYFISRVKLTCLTTV